MFLVLSDDVQVFARTRRDRPHRLAGRLVQGLPGIFTTADQIAEEQAGDRAMGHAVARITRGYVHIVIAWVATDESKTVNGLHHLPRPLQRHVPYHREAFTRP